MSLRKFSEHSCREERVVFTFFFAPGRSWMLLSLTLGSLVTSNPFRIHVEVDMIKLCYNAIRINICVTRVLFLLRIALHHNDIHSLTKKYRRLLIIVP